MIFDIHDYYIHLFFWPMINLFTIIMIIVGCGYGIYKYLKTKKLKHLLVSLVFLGFSLTLLNSVLYNLEYGLPLRDEKQNDAIINQGEIIRLERVKHEPRFVYEDEYSIPYIITIDGIEYYTMSAEGYIEGDIIEILYLPKSRIILEISHID